MPDPIPDPPTPPVPDPPTPPVADPPRTFTQEEVNAILAKNKRSTPPDDYEELKAAAAKLAEIETANQSELEKAQAATAKATEERDAALERAKITTVRSAVIAAASKAGAVDPDDVFALLTKDAVTIGDDGQVTGVEEAVKALLDAKPHLVGKSAPTGSADGGAQGTPGLAQLTREHLKTMTPEAIVEAKAKGQLNTLLGVTT